MNGTAHVIILSDIRFVCTGLPFFVILKLDIAFDPVLLQIGKILFAAVTAVRSDCFQLFPKCFPVLFQNRDQRVVISPVAADITVDNEIVLYCDLDIVCRRSRSCMKNWRPAAAA